VFKASIALVALAFVTLAYGWVRGNDLLLFGSIAFSALAGVALMRSTIQERRRHPELTRKGRRAAEVRARDRKSLAELRSELTGLKTEIGAGGEGPPPRRKPLRPFGDLPRAEEAEGARLAPRPAVPIDEEERRLARAAPPTYEEVPLRRPARERSVLPADEEASVRRPARERSVLPADEEVPVRRPARDRGVSLEQRVRRPESRRPSGPADVDDFRSRLSAVLGEAPGGAEPEAPPRARAASRRPEPEEEIGTDWIRIDDLPRISRPRASNSTPRSEPASPAKRRTAPPTKAATTPKRTTTTPRAPRGSKSAPKAAPGSEPPK
jgi:hypothetical protein